MGRVELDVCGTGRTCNNHHADSEDLLIVRLRRDVAKPDGGHARHGEVERCYVHSLLAGSVDELQRVGAVGDDVGVGGLRDIGQLPQPRVLDPVVRVALTCSKGKTLASVRK